MRLLCDLLRFAAARRKLWLFPIIVALLLLGLLIVLTQMVAISPFVYTLF